MINPSYCSYKPTERYLTGAPLYLCLVGMLIHFYRWNRHRILHLVEIHHQLSTWLGGSSADWRLLMTNKPGGIWWREVFAGFIPWKSVAKITTPSDLSTIPACHGVFQLVGDHQARFLVGFWMVFANGKLRWTKLMMNRGAPRHGNPPNFYPPTGSPGDPRPIPIWRPSPKAWLGGKKKESVTK